MKQEYEEKLKKRKKYKEEKKKDAKKDKDDDTEKKPAKETGGDNDQVEKERDEKVCHSAAFLASVVITATFAYCG